MVAAVVSSRATAYLAEAETHQRVAARHYEMSCDWVRDGNYVLASKAQQFAAARYAAARDCVDMRMCPDFNYSHVYTPPVPW